MKNIRYLSGKTIQNSQANYVNQTHNQGSIDASSIGGAVSKTFLPKYSRLPKSLDTLQVQIQSNSVKL